VQDSPATAEPAAPAPPTRRPAGRRWPIIALVLACLMLPAAALVVQNPGWFSRSSSRPGELPDRLRIPLAELAVSALQNAPQIEHLGHDEDNAGARRVMCTADPFGVDPPKAATVAQVQWVYAQHLCVIGQPGLPWDYATKSAGPVAVGLGNPPVVRLPVPQVDYRTQVRQMIPARYQPMAFGSFTHPELVAKLRQRYTTEVASTASS
jgi:hypothetical protein